ncbi:hypothetical protein LP421_12705 [Rhizobium sp. RCAM05350]|nr:hypothetical protein LP421_12705 [Rhizobium sp. RCAM05350]
MGSSQVGQRIALVDECGCGTVGDVYELMIRNICNRNHGLFAAPASEMGFLC